MGQQFTSLDGVDERGHRAEVLVATGTGFIDEIKDYGSNAQIRLKNDILRHPLGGFIAKSDPLFASLEQAHEQGREIAYRVEQQRKKSVDRTVPIQELRKNMEEAKANCIWVFAAMDDQFSTEAVTNPAEDPAEGGRRRAVDTAPQTAPSQQSAPSAPALDPAQVLTGLAQGRQAGLPDSILDATAALALALGASVEQVMSAGVEVDQAPERRELQRVRAREAAPFNAYNTDGHINLGSYAVQAAVGAENFAFDQMSAHAAAVAEAHNAKIAAGEITGEPVDPAPVDFRSAAAMALQVLDLADRVQVGAYGGGRPNRMAASHTRARGFVYDAIRERFPIPFGGDETARQLWRDSVITESVARFQWAAQIADEFLPAQEAPVESGQPTATADAQDPASAATAPAGQPGDGPRESAPDAQVSETETQQAAAPATSPATVEAPGETTNQSQVRSIGDSTGARPRVLVEGDEGFQAPDQDTLRSFADLAEAAGFAPGPDSPIAGYLTSKFGVSAARKVHGPALALMLDWYRNKGEDAPRMFREHVNREVGLANAG